MIRPSTELLRDLFKIKDEYIFGVAIIEDELSFFHSDSRNNLGARMRISIYECMHIMKEWATSEGFALFTGRIGKEFNPMCKAYVNREMGKRYVKLATGSTEFEAVEKVCEWILKDTK